MARRVVGSAYGPSRGAVPKTISSPGVSPETQAVRRSIGARDFLERSSPRLRIAPKCRPSIRRGPVPSSRLKVEHEALRVFEAFLYAHEEGHGLFAVDQAV